jgi:hypothetical protein
LLVDPAPLTYLAERGFGKEVVEQAQLGYAAGGELVPYLAWRGLPAHAARRAGLLDSDGRERLAGRVVFPEVRDGEPIWLIGRLLDAASQDPRYLGLPGVKPLLGGRTLNATTAAPVWSKARSICWRYASGASQASRFAVPARRPTPSLSLRAGTASMRFSTLTPLAGMQPRVSSTCSARA